MAGFLSTLLLLAGIFLIFIVLLQRGRGGGLAGAFGGQGGQSVLGVKAGDVFTKITCGIALAWVLLAGFSGMAMRSTESRFKDTSITEDEDSEQSSGNENSEGTNETVPTAPDADGDESESTDEADKAGSEEQAEDTSAPANDDEGSGTPEEDE